MLLLELDLDGVVADTHSAVEKLVRADGFADFSVNNIRTYDCTTLSDAERDCFLSHIYSPCIYESVDFMAGFLSFWKAVGSGSSDRFAIVFHSHSKDMRLASAKDKWLRTRLGSDINIVHSVGVSKICLASTHLIEDSYDNIRVAMSNLASTKHAYFLFDRPWNRSESVSCFDSCYRLFGWNDSENLLGELGGVCF